MPKDMLRIKHQKRAEEQIALTNNITPKRLQKTPSQKTSERLRKKLARGVAESAAVIPNDCRDCKKTCAHGNNLEICADRSLVVRCGKCGQKVRVRVYDDGGERYLCPVCKAQERKV